MSEQLYRVVTGNACFGIVVEEGVVTRAAPIAAKAAGLSSVVGQSWAAIQGRYRQVEEVGRSVWVRDKRTGGIVGYMTPDRKLVRIANAGALYARYLRFLRAAREGE